jgi:predicted Zn-dependent peptidase
MGSLASGQFSAEVVKSFALDNGMKILVYEDHSIPNANMYLFYRVGSRNEYPGITGLSHFFEHMMFNGAKKYGPKEFDRVMEASGGSNNAYTTNDVTVYTDWFPTKSLEVIFDLEADRIGNLAIDPGMVESERGVVLSERSTGLENSNFERLSTQVHAAAFFAHPYKWPVIGYESDIKSWTQADLEWYFKTYYAPNNCVVVIAGDVQLETVKALAQKYFSPLAAQPAPAPLRTVEPPQEGLKRVTVLKDVSTPNLEIVHHVPQASHPDYYALDMLNAILSSGPSSRLQKSLVFEQELATEIWTYMPASMDPDLFVTFAVAADGVDAGKLESAILNEIDRIVREGVTDAELRKVKNQKSMEFYRSIETINGKANSLGTFELFFGDYKRMFEAPALYEKVTREDIQRVAATYFIEKNRTIGYLMPEEKKP